MLNCFQTKRKDCDIYPEDVRFSIPIFDLKRTLRLTLRYKIIPNCNGNIQLSLLQHVRPVFVHLGWSLLLTTE